ESDDTSTTTTMIYSSQSSRLTFPALYLLSALFPTSMFLLHLRVEVLSRFFSHST
ncbi:hypothetical protein HN51_014812, partial [Arachis hypogaea]